VEQLGIKPGHDFAGVSHLRIGQTGVGKTVNQNPERHFLLLHLLIHLAGG
jgi:hypothetical protein